MPTLIHKMASSVVDAVSTTRAVTTIERDPRIADKSETLLENSWLSLKLLKSPDDGVQGYVYSSESRCDGGIVSVLPYRVKDGVTEYLLRQEVTPPWNLTEKCLSSITGGCEKDSTPAGDAIRELEEEASIKATEDQLQFLGNCYGPKSADTIYYLYALDVGFLGDQDMTSGAGDGSELEAKANNKWFSEADLVTAVDPLVHVLFNRLKTSIGFAQ